VSFFCSLATLKHSFLSDVVDLKNLGNINSGEINSTKLNKLKDMVDELLE
jgi:hypothetical protein